MFKIKSMRKISCLYWALALMAGACSDDKDDENVSERQEIQIRYEVNQARMEARSSVSGFEVGEKVHLYIAERTEENTPAAPTDENLYMMTCGTDGMLTFEDGGEHLYPENPIDLYAFYQKGLTTEQGDLTAVTVSVQADQNAEGAEEKSDFLYAEAKEGFGNSTDPIKLTFDHQFARLHFTFKTNTPEQVVLNELSAVEIQGVVTDGTFNVQTGEFTLGSAEGNIMACLTGSSNGEATAIIVPQTLKEGATFSFTVGEEEFTYTMPTEERDFAKGTQYNYTVTLDKYAELPQQQVQVESSVGFWGEEEREITLSKGETVKVTLSDVAEGVTITKADLYFGGGIVQEGVTVTDNKMEIVYPLLSEDGKVTLEQAHFYTSAGEEFDYYFVEKELKGNGTDVLALTPPEVGASWGEGVVFVVGEVTGYDWKLHEFKTDQTGINAYRGRIVADNDFTPKLAWSNSPKAINDVIGMVDTIDGMKNIQVLKTFIEENNENVEDYPLYQAVLELDGWYVPSSNEMRFLLVNQKLINSILQERRGELLDYKKYAYITSTEFAPYVSVEGSTKHNYMSRLYYNMTPVGGVPTPLQKDAASANIRLVKAF